MSSRNRSPRIFGSRRQRRSLPPLLENLENRLVLSQILPNSEPLSATTDSSPAHGQQSAGPIEAHAPVANPFGSGTDQFPGPVGYTPQQLQQAYGVNLITYGPTHIAGDGTGQTIAIIDWGDDLSFEPTTSPSYVGSALQVFDQTFHLPDPPSFQIFTQNGAVGRTNTNLGTGVEIALDVEWAHSIAPGATIDLVEAKSAGFMDTGEAELSAATVLHASVVSMSFGGFLEGAGAGSYEQQLDDTFFAPALAADPNITYLASTGDDGSNPGPSYPSISPLVVGVGGTTLTVNGTSPTFSYGGETGWSGSGGGVSNFYPQPTYQLNNGFTYPPGLSGRTVPDISSDADPNTGVAVYDPQDFGAATPWDEIGGTSLSSPTWAGFIAIADQGRQVLYGEAPLGGPTQTLPALYDLQNLPNSYNVYFHDIVTGNTGLYSAGPGYDLVTGIGSPRTENLLPALAAFGTVSSAQITVQPPNHVIQDGNFGTAVEAVTSNGTLALGFSGTATISLTSGPGTLTGTLTVNFNNGVAVFDDLELSTVSATPNTFSIAVKNGSATLVTLTPDPVVVDTARTAGVGVYYPLPIDSSLRHDVSAVDGDSSNTTDDLYLVYSQTYELFSGQLLLKNTSGLPSKTINWISQDQFGSNAPTIDANQSGRVFDIVGTNGTSTNLSVIFQGLTQGLVISGGLANDDGGLVVPNGTVVGGGLLVDGGNVTLRNVTLSGNEARGSTGSQGSSGASGVSAGPGGRGGHGGTGEGGAIYVASGSLTLASDTLIGNIARGGVGGLGGTGGFAGTNSGSFIIVRPISGGPGGTGGIGGTGQGGALYIAGGTVSVTSGSMKSNTAVGGVGGRGGSGGHGGTVAFPGGSGGLGGVGGQGQGGGIYLKQGSLHLNNAGVVTNSALGGAGGSGGTGGTGGFSFGGQGQLGRGGDGGAGGKGGSGSGGGLYVLTGTISWLDSSVNDNTAAGGAGGPGGTVGIEPHAGGGGAAGKGGTGAGGGIFDQGTLTLTNASIAGNKADNGGGIDIHGTLTLVSSQVESNTAVSDGGGIISTGVTVITTSTLSGNSAALGGAIDSSGTLTIDGGELLTNTASQSGGGIFLSGTGTILNTHAPTDFDSNSAGLGGGIFNSANSNLTVTGASFENNHAVSGGGIYSLATLQVFSSSFGSNSASGGATDNQGGGILNNGGTLAVTGSTFDANSAGDGGGIANIHGSLTITGGSFTGNTASSLGGAIDSSGTLTLSGVSLEDNSAASGSGGAIANQGTLAITNGSLITDNSAQKGGGIANAGTLSLADISLSNNSANAQGGAIYNTSGSISISGGNLGGNTALGFGGGIYLNQGSLTIAANTSLSFNTASNGGAIYNAAGTASLTNVTLFNNAAAGSGGAIDSANRLTVNIASIFDNRASNGGGIDNAGIGTLIDVTLSGDSASQNGGGIFNQGTLSLTNSTIAAESAANGGGIFNSAGQLTTVNVTIAENSVTGGSGGGLDVGGGNVLLSNTIVSANTSGTGVNASANDVSGTVSSSSAFNLIGAGGAGGLIDGMNHNQVGAAPKLGTLADNGGPTETIALLAGSPAIDKGGNSISGVTVPNTDERGALRGGVSGETGIHAGTAVDIGAYEASSSYLVTTTVDSLAFGTLRSAVNWANLSFNDNPANLSPNTPAPNTVVFDTANLFSTPQTITLTQGSLVFSGTAAPEAIAGDGVSKLTISGGNALEPIAVDHNVVVGLTAFTLSGGFATGTGGGIDNQGILTLTGMSVTGNHTSTASGGGIENESDGTLTVVNTTISNNTAAVSGGAINNDGTLIVENSLLSNNSAGMGGAIGSDGVLQFSSSTLSGNSATNGGGIANDSSSPLVILDATFSNNSAAGLGGGIDNTGGTMTVTGSTFSGNTAGTSGGGIYNDAGSATAVDSTFSGNSASQTGSGGGIFSDSTLALTNSTVANNSALNGGGIDSAGTLTAVNATIAYNTVATGGAGGGLDVSAGTTTLYNTIVALNTIGGGASSDIAGTVRASSVHNLIGTGGSGGLINGAGGNLVGIAAPGLASGLANNGGPTQTIALVTGSAAINAGGNVITGITVPTVDQRGAQRGPAGVEAGLNVDIGAYEASSSYLVSTTTDSSDVGTLRTAVGWANISTNPNSPETPNTIVFGVAGPFVLSQGPLALTNTSLDVVIDAPGQTISGGNVSSVFTVASGVTASISGSASSPLTITGGNAANNGGGIDNSGTLTLTDVTLTGNTATNGGALANEAAATFTLTDSSVSGNTAMTSGGGIDNMGTGTVLHDVIGGNVAGNGGGIANLLSGISIGSGNSSAPAPADLTISETTLTANSAASGGGIDNTGTLTLSVSTLTANSASVAGGGIDDEAGGSLTATNLTLANNTAATGGGLFTGGTVVLVNATVAYNQAGIGGGLAVSGIAVDTLDNTIVAANTQGGSSAASDIALVGGGLISPVSSFNLIGTGGAGNLINGINHNRILTGTASPGLANGLANNGGPTQTIALRASSPAIDAGSASISGVIIPVTDQRGAVRGTAGLDAGPAPDVGAFEESSSYLVTTASGRPDVGTIETAVEWANVNVNVNPSNPTPSAANTILFDSKGAFSTAQTITLAAPLVFNTTVATPEAIDASKTIGLTLSGGNAVGVLEIDSGTTVTITALTIANGSAINGGGIDNSGSLTINDATISQNRAANGGAIDNEAGATLTIQSSTLSNNSATTGGAIDNAGTATLTNTTIADDSASTGGGIDNSGTLTTINAVIAYNTAGTGGGLYLNSGTAALYNTIVALNTSGTSANDIATAIGVKVAASSAFNLTGTGGSGGLSSAPAQGNVLNVSSAGLHLGPLANNGGPTATIALLAGSPALNTGAGVISIPGVNVPLTDQRGAGRPNATGAIRIDIGAFEVSSSYLVTTTADTLSSGTLRSALVWANTTPSSALSGPNTILFDPALFNTTTPQTIILSPTFGTLDLTDTSSSGILIEGPGAGAVTISGNGILGVFAVEAGVTAAFSDLTIGGGSGISGGAIMNLGKLTITDVNFADNAVASYGGAIYNNGGTVTITNANFTNNSATFGLGGAIDNTGTLAIVGSTFTGGNAFQGGAIDNRSGSLAVTNSTFTSNIAIMGGAIFNNAVATVFGSTIANNMALSSPSGATPTAAASFDGGAIANDHTGVLTITNSTIAFNAAGQAGGGIDTVGVLTAVNDTIAYNIVASGGSGGGIDASAGTTTLFNTIVVLNTSGTGTTATPSDLSGNVVLTSAFNLLGTGGAGGLTDGTNGNQVAVTSPGLATTLANNGGPTLTLALLAGSPAIDTGSNVLAVDAIGNPLRFDQRGQAFPRIVNSVVDIGAFERSLATTTTLTSSLNPSVVGSPVTFTVTVSPSNTNPTTPTGIVTFFNGSITLATVGLVNGTATFVTSSLPFGVSVISAVYSGNLTFATSTSTSLSQTINLLPTVPLLATLTITPPAPAFASLAIPSVASTPPPTIMAAAVPHAKVAKKAAAPKKTHPKGGSSVKFHQTKHAAVLKRSVAIIAKHVNVKVKKK